MTRPGVAGWGFLAFAGLLLPLAALLFAGAERRGADANAEGGPPRVVLYAQALLTHAILLAAALAAARVSDLSLAIVAPVKPADLLFASVTLAAVIALGELSWRSRSPAERERLWVRRILPRSPAERRAWVILSAGAAIAEEIAYRGAFVAFALSVTGSLAFAILGSALAFAVVHAPQGASSVAYVFVIALLHHALVLLTGTLLLAIVVHFVYDVVAGLWLARRHGL